jgi:diadenylate cyclase
MLFKIGFLKVTFIDVLDIALVSYIFYKIYVFIRGSMAARMLAGLLTILLLSVIADSFNMSSSSWIFSNLKTVWVIAFVIIFQPEFRRLLLHIGQNPILQKIVRVETPQFIEEVVSSATDLSQKNFGALIVLLRDTGLKSILETGISIQAQVSRQILMSIFNPRAPLHDGAVVIQGNVILAAKCQLPLTQNPKLDPTLGMRHRAALGLSEQTDALILVVSEETGMVSLAEDGVLTRGLTEESLSNRLRKAFTVATEKKKKKSLSDLLNWSEQV